jgi:hypothetical protein
MSVPVTYELSATPSGVRSEPTPAARALRSPQRAATYENSSIRSRTIWNVGAAGVALADPNRVEPHNRALRDAARTIDSWAYAEG